MTFAEIYTDREAVRLDNSMVVLVKERTRRLHTITTTEES